MFTPMAQVGVLGELPGYAPKGPTVVLVAGTVARPVELGVVIGGGEADDFPGDGYLCKVKVISVFFVMLSMCSLIVVWPTVDTVVVKGGGMRLLVVAYYVG